MNMEFNYSDTVDQFLDLTNPVFNSESKRIWGASALMLGSQYNRALLGAFWSAAQSVDGMKSYFPKESLPNSRPLLQQLQIKHNPTWELFARLDSAAALANRIANHINDNPKNLITEREQKARSLMYLLAILAGAARIEGLEMYQEHLETEIRRCNKKESAAATFN